MSEDRRPDTRPGPDDPGRAEYGQGDYGQGEYDQGEPGEGDPGRDPERVYAWYRQGRERLDAGEPHAAAELLELAAEAEPRQASLHEALGRACLASRQNERARVAFERVLELDPTDAYAHYGVARCHERAGDLAAAERHLKLACALYPRDEYRRVLARVSARRR